MKILWMSDSPTTPSGYGNVTRFVCSGLADRGHHVSILGWQTQGQPTLWQNCTLHPGTFSADALLNYLRTLQPDILITLGDIPRLTYFSNSLIEFLHTAGIPWVLYYPLDGHQEDKHLPSSWIRILKAVDLPIAMSHYGRDVTQANGIEPAYIPLGVDTTIFQPPADKSFAKQALSYQEKFVILSDARNAPRKMLPRTLEIFRHFADAKDDVILHLHCNSNDPFVRSAEYCYDLQSDIALLNLTDKVHLTKDLTACTGLPIEQLAQLYQAADAHLLTSLGEGLGMSNLQAAASGVVPLAPDYAASRELVLNHGEAISIHHILRDQFGLHRALVNIEDAVSKLEKLYRDRKFLAHKAHSARDFACAYDWQHIIPQWEELLDHTISQRSTNQHAIHTPSLSTQELSNHTCVADNTADLVTELLQEVQLESTIKIPVTLPLVRSKQRISGCVYVASQHDIPVVLALQHIFPGLSIWSTIPLDFDASISDSQSVQKKLWVSDYSFFLFAHNKTTSVTSTQAQSSDPMLDKPDSLCPEALKVVRADSPEYRPHLAISTLALDIAGRDPRLSVEAAKLGVPCISLAQQKDQAWLWPDSSLEKPDPRAAAKLGRQLLTDQGMTASRCLQARQQLASVPASTAHDSISR